MKISLKSALVALVFVVSLGGLIPAALLLDHRLVEALEEGVREDLGTAPVVLTERFANRAGAWMMHAKELAEDARMGASVESGNEAEAIAEAARLVAAFPGEAPVVVRSDGRSLIGPSVPEAMLDETRGGGMPVRALQSDQGFGTLAIAPVMVDGAWTGAAGVWVPLADEEAAQLSALTRSNVLLTAPDETLAAYTGRAEPAMGLFGLLAQQPLSDEVRELRLGRDRYFVVTASLPGDGRVSFVRDLSEELAIVPRLRAVGAGVLGLVLLAALLFGLWFAAQLSRPVDSLAVAARRISDGDFDAGVRHSFVREVDDVSAAFEVMRDALALRIEELALANEELADRQERLGVLQAELVQRDRLSAASRLLAQLAHEVRNPVASVRNCLEVLRRRVDGDEEASELADLAIDELLRMHELAEQMLDLHRPRSDEGDCDARAVAEDVAAVVRVGMGDADIEVAVAEGAPVWIDMPGDPLKQVLLNLVQNAQDALTEGTGTIDIRVERSGDNARIDVVDSGPGITDDALPQVFDPFFTTKADVRGVGLGLFTAAGIVRSHGGRIAAANRSDGRGARLTVEVPLRDRQPQEALA